MRPSNNVMPYTFIFLLCKRSLLCVLGKLSGSKLWFLCCFCGLRLFMTHSGFVHWLYEKIMAWKDKKTKIKKIKIKKKQEFNSK